MKAEKRNGDPKSVERKKNLKKKKENEKENTPLELILSVLITHIAASFQRMRIFSDHTLTNSVNAVNGLFNIPLVVVLTGFISLLISSAVYSFVFL